MNKLNVIYWLNKNFSLSDTSRYGYVYVYPLSESSLIIGLFIIYLTAKETHSNKLLISLPFIFNMLQFICHSVEIYDNIIRLQPKD